MRPHHTIGLLLSTVMVGGACSLFSGSGSTPQPPSGATVACIVRYQGCASALTDASTMADYLACRGAVDRDCLLDGGAP